MSANPHPLETMPKSQLRMILAFSELCQSAIDKGLNVDGSLLFDGRKVKMKVRTRARK